MHQIRVTSGPQAGRVLALDPQYSYSVGRGADAHMSVPEDNTLSRTHAELVPQGGGWILRNKSQHGSLVGGNVIQGDQALSPGLAFQLGETQFVFEAAGAAAGAAAAGGGGNAPAPNPSPSPSSSPAASPTPVASATPGASPAPQPLAPRRRGGGSCSISAASAGASPGVLWLLGLVLLGLLRARSDGTSDGAR